MKLNWERYFYDMFSSVFRHMGTALAGWSGLNIANAAGADVPQLDIKALGVFLISAGIIPAVASFWTKTPLPEIEKEETTVTVTKTTTKTPPDEKPTSIDPPASNP
jgi:hypothetical protein